MPRVRHADGSPRGAARERVLDAAYRLFSQRGVRAVGVEEIIDRAGVAKATLYRHFPSKNDLVLAFLQRREERWTHGLVQSQATSRGATAEQQLLAIFDVLGDWFRSKSFDACPFINVLLELGPQHPAGRASAEHLGNVRSIVRRLADEARLRDTEAFARSWHILMNGSIIAAAEGDRDAAQRAKRMAALLIDEHR